jgi:methionyl-tRNA synthetase
MPDKASQLLDMIGVDKSRREFKDTLLGTDKTYGDAAAPLGKGAWDSLFPPLSVEN